MAKQDLHIIGNISIPANELNIQVSTSGGPGGQHVNKTSTKVTLRWNLLSSAALNEEQQQRIAERLQSRLTTRGDLIVQADDTRSQRTNLEKARERLAELLREALFVPKKRKKTRIPRSVKRKRLDQKKQRSLTKKGRQKYRGDD
jgi:ribosome-associated protein